MNEIPDPHFLAARLKRAGMTIDDQEIGDPASKDNRDYLEILGAAPAPDAIDRVYRKFDHFSLAWRGELSGRAVQGTLNIIAFDLSLARAPGADWDQPLEGILWTDDTPPKAREQLKRMTIFETVQGRSQFISYIVEDGQPKMFLVDRDEVRPLATDFAETLSALFEYAGAEGMREYLTHADWNKRLQNDGLLAAIRALA
jgi:hypothetical protein